MSLFGTDHLQPGQGTGGASFSLWESAEQLWEQQFRVDSPLSLEQEIQNRWDENINNLQRLTGETFEMPRVSAYEGPSLGALGAYLEYLETGSTSYNSRAILGKSIEETLAPFQRADARAAALGDPSVKTFSEIVQEVYQMQREVEERTGEVSERGSFIGSLLGAMAGSFTTRDPLGLYSLTVGGAGRTAAVRIASEMGIAGAVVGANEFAYVLPNREQAGLPERNSLLDIGAAALGAGALRGVFEGAAAGARHLTPLDIRLARELAKAEPLGDRVLVESLALAAHSPRARAGLEMVENDIELSKANPYGDTRTGTERFLAELAEVQKVLGGVPQTAVARALPPIPFEYVENAVDFTVVRERSPELWARLEEAEAALADINKPTASLKEDEVALSPNGLFVEGQRHNNEVFLSYQPSVREAAIPIHMRIEDGVAEISVDQFSELSNRLGVSKVREAMNELMLMYPEINSFKGERNSGAGAGRTQTISSRRQAANARYRKAYAEVEAEANRIREEQRLLERAQQGDAVDLLGHSTLRPFLGPILDHANVERRVAELNEFAETIPDHAVALSRAELDEDGTVDIGLSKRVDGGFRFMTEAEDGSVREMSIAEALDDFREDEALEEAMRTCLL